jgi:hypothetical protein
MRVVWSLIILFIGMVIGGFLVYQQQPGDIPVIVTEQIVLTIPKNDKEAEKQLLYMAASKGMLEEIHRQKVLRKR